MDKFLSDKEIDAIIAMTKPSMTPKQKLIETVKGLFKAKPKQHTYIYCDCGNEMCSDGSFVSDTYDKNGKNHVLYECKECGLNYDYDFDLPVPIKNIA